MRALARRVPLRRALVATLLLLVTLALVGSGFATHATLRGYLLERVDDQLRGAAPVVAGSGGADETLERRPGPGGRGPLPSAFVVQVVDGSGATVVGPTSNLLDDEPLPDLPDDPEAGPDGTSFTVAAVSGDGQWRVRAVDVTLSDGTQGTLMVAQSLEDVQGILDRLVLLLLVIGGVTVAVLGAVGYLLVRGSLKPLQDVERTAARIAAGDLGERVPHADPRSEVGQLAAALNVMLAQIESAFAEREAGERAARGSEERMRRFVADASHELRTPLTTIRGFAELYRQGAVSDDDGVRRLVGRIEGEAARMGLLVEDLLLLARLDQQRPLAREPVDLLALTTEAVESARAVAPQRPLALEVGALEGLPVVLGDGPRLRQVLDNLIGNALRHTPADARVTVSVGTRHDTGGEPRVRVEVADEGPGMDPDHAARVFERFYRADESRNRNDGGSGLGLAIASSLVQAHGGSISVDTAPGRGARFRVDLPAER
ncbi:two-component sensor histidine kinase [Nocardioides sp. OK12]|uniref:sensor histidine kinase n=1 Tax=Nocardioides sp. OK12 TaxID=2758661 RepID=UPI0021C36802|nr:HAMP domain-containing sensor histidine kinase [Nocardioides sp. OK12]GHJ59781.1 two-component sensor histidine kinase [Nocardioides sp. OK12]